MTSNFCFMASQAHISIDSAGARAAPIAANAKVAGSLSPLVKTLVESVPAPKLVENTGFFRSVPSGSIPYRAVGEG